jgi:CIC family chloride channel protein
MLGDAFGSVAHALFPGWTAGPPAYALVAMAAAFAAAAEAPITAIVIVFEMSDDYTIVLPLMIATVISSLAGRRLLGATVYERKLLRRGIDWRAVRRPRPLAHIRVAALQREPSDVVRAGEAVRDVAARLRNGSDDLLPVLTPEGEFLGFAGIADLAAVAGRDPDATVDSLVRPAAATLHGDESLETIIAPMLERDAALLPIIGLDGRLRGVVSRRDVLAAYNSLAPL